MIWIIILLGVILALVMAVHLYYRHQINLLSQQLEKLKDLETNSLLTQEIYSPEVNKLVEEINQAISKERHLRLQLKRKELSTQELMTNLSHDVRTPLTSLVGYIQLMETCDNEADRQRYFEIIYQRIDKLKDLLDRLFLLEKLDLADFQPELQSVNLTETVTQLMLSYFDQLNRAGFEVAFEIGEVPVWVVGETKLVHHVLENLIKNVMDHGRDRLEMTLDVTDDQVVLTLRNGLRHKVEEDPNNWLDRFYQAKFDRSRTNQNTGLGLSIVKSAMEKMQGQVSLRVDADDLAVVLKFKKASFPEE